MGNGIVRMPHYLRRHLLLVRDINATSNIVQHFAARWETRTVTSTRMIMRQDQFLLKRSNRISVKEDVSSYNKYKDEHEFEEYVDILPAYQHATEGLHLTNGLRGQQRLKYSPMYYFMQISLFM